MNVSTLARHAHEMLSAATARGEWSDWHTARTGYMIRDLTPAVQSLMDDNVPFLLTHRDRPRVATRVGRPEATGVDVPNATSARRRVSARGREHASAHASRSHSSSRSPKLSVAEWQARDAWVAQPRPGDRQRGGRIARLYSLFVEVPTGIVWELISERFNTNRLRGAAPESVALRRPCDDHPLEDVPRLFPSDDPHLQSMFGPAAGRPLPDPTAMIVRHHTCVASCTIASAPFTSSCSSERDKRASQLPITQSVDRRVRRATAPPTRLSEANIPWTRTVSRDQPRGRSVRCARYDAGCRRSAL